MFRFFVALSLFARVDKTPVAYITGQLSPGRFDSTYYVGWRDGNFLRSIGWAHVSPKSISCSWWNEAMRTRNLVFALWSKDNIGTWPLPGQKWPDLSTYQQVQLTTVYPIRAFTEKGAAQKALELLKAGDDSNTEWYDASPDRNWSKLFKH